MSLIKKIDIEEDYGCYIEINRHFPYYYLRKSFKYIIKFK